MEMVTKKVRTGKKVVWEGELPLYDTLDEIREHETEETIVARFNEGNHVKLMGNKRLEYSGKATTKKMRRKLAFECITTEELMAVAQDGDKMEALLFSDEVQARVDAKLKANLEAATANIQEDDAPEDE
ncbi:MAG: hypothetical protein ACTSXA_00610 [Candidatus Heimdallarchaeota archaeon]